MFCRVCYRNSPAKWIGSMLIRRSVPRGSQSRRTGEPALADVRALPGFWPGRIAFPPRDSFAPRRQLGLVPVQRSAGTFKNNMPEMFVYDIAEYQLGNPRSLYAGTARERARKSFDFLDRCGVPEITINSRFILDDYFPSTRSAAEKHGHPRTYRSSASRSIASARQSSCGIRALDRPCIDCQSPRRLPR